MTKYRHNKNTNQQHYQKEKTLYKEILIPTISAIIGSVVTILISQIFFYGNTKSQVEFELRKEIYKEQLPVINRILNMTNKFTIITKPFVFKDGGVLAKAIVYIDSNNTVVRRDTIAYKDTTINITLPDFIYEENKRYIFITNINKLKAQISAIEYDQDLISVIEEVLYFIDTNPIPENINTQIMFNTKWNDNENIEKWYLLISRLRAICVKKKQEFKLK